MVIFLSVTFVLVLGFCHLINKAAAKSIERLLNPRELLSRIDDSETGGYGTAIDEFGAWAAKNGFVPELKFVFSTMNPDAPLVCASWWFDLHKTWALIYLGPSISNIDFVTVYNDNIGVTTCSSKDGIMLPHIPSAYRQSFTDLSPDGLYQRHLDARALVEAYEAVPLPGEKGDLLAQIEFAMKRQAEFIMSLPLWRYRGVFWFFIRRNLMANKPISPGGR